MDQRICIQALAKRLKFKEVVVAGLTPATVTRDRPDQRLSLGFFVFFVTAFSNCMTGERAEHQAGLSSGTCPHLRANPLNPFMLAKLSWILGTRGFSD